METTKKRQFKTIIKSDLKAAGKANLIGIISSVSANPGRIIISVKREASAKLKEQLNKFAQRYSSTQYSMSRDYHEVVKNIHNVERRAEFVFVQNEY